MNSANLFIILFCVSFLCISLSGQQSFPAGEAVWQTDEITIAGPIKNYYRQCGDTVINNINYQKVYRLTYISSSEEFSETYIGATRVEGDESWYIQVNQETEILLYSFNLEAGDEILVQDFSSQDVLLKVDSVGTILVDGEARKAIYFEEMQQNIEVEYWIYGIGSNYGPFTRGYVPASDWDPRLVCYNSQEDNFIVPESTVVCTIEEVDPCGGISDTGDLDLFEEMVSVFPNPFKDQFTVKFSQTYSSDSIELQLLDLQGRIVKKVEEVRNGEPVLTIGDLPAGVYILRLVSGHRAQSRKILKVGG